MVNIDIINLIDVVTKADIQAAIEALECKRLIKLKDIVRYTKEGSLQCAVNSMSQFDKCVELIDFLNRITPSDNYIETV